MNARILVVDDEFEAVDTLVRVLEEEGYEVVIAEDRAEALHYYDSFRPDLMVMDIRFGGDERLGLDILKEVRQLRHDANIPIIMLTGVSDDELEPLSFDLRATDFVSKSRPTKAILARLKARLYPAGNALVVIDDYIQIDLSRTTVRVNKGAGWGDVHLEPREYAILSKLVCNPGRVISLEVLESYFPDALNPASTLRRYIAELRKALEPLPGQPRYILTKRGVGYWFRDYR